MPDSTLSALYGRHAWRRHSVCCGFRSWPCVTERTWALTVSDKNVVNELWFQSICGLYEFSPGDGVGDEPELSSWTWLLFTLCSIISQISWDVWPFCIVVQQMRRSVSEPRKTCVADALSLCGSWASCFNHMTNHHRPVTGCTLCLVGMLRISHCSLVPRDDWCVSVSVTNCHEHDWMSGD